MDTFFTTEIGIVHHLAAFRLHVFYLDISTNLTFWWKVPTFEGPDFLVVLLSIVSHNLPLLGSHPHRAVDKKCGFGLRLRPAAPQSIRFNRSF